jgi:putative ABC transport system permease protein
VRGPERDPPLPHGGDDRQRAQGAPLARDRDAVLGAKGSELQLVLNTVFHLETSPGKIPWSLYADMKRDPRVSLAIPYAVGDHYRDFRIVGTTAELFERYYRDGFRDGYREFRAARSPRDS